MNAGDSPFIEILIEFMRIRCGPDIKWSTCRDHSRLSAADINAVARLSFTRKRIHAPTFSKILVYTLIQAISGDNTSVSTSYSWHFVVTNVFVAAGEAARRLMIV